MEHGFCKFCGQAYMVDADPEATEEELNELATAKCGCEGATYYAWKKSTLEVFAQDLEVVFGKENKEMKDLFADAGKMIMNGKMKALTIKQSDEKTLNLKMKKKACVSQSRRRARWRTSPMADLLYPKMRDKKRRKKHKPSIIQKKDGRCYLCMKLHGDYSVKRTEEHHVYFGPLRDISEANGFKVYLCRIHHIHAGGPEAVHRNHETCLMVQQDVQRRFEQTHTRAEFMALIGRSYL